MRYSFVADHFQYLASIGPVVLVGMAMVAVSLRLRSIGKTFLVSVTALLVAALGALTWRQTHVYANRETLWRDTLRKNPDAWIAHTNLGALLVESQISLGPDKWDRGKLDEGIDHYRQALRLNPNDAEAHFNLGITLGMLNDVDGAIRHYRQAVSIRPTYAKALYCLDVALASEGEFHEAAECYRRVLEEEPSFAEAHYHLANALLAEGHLDEAIDAYRQALKFNHDFPLARSNLESVLNLRHRLLRIIHDHRSRLENDPEDAQTHLNLGRALIMTGDNEEAFNHFQAAIRLRPDWAAPLNEMAWIRATHPDPQMRSGTEAVTLAERACDLTSNENVAMLDTLAAAYAETGQFDRATATAERAMEQAEKQDAQEAAQAISGRVTRYRTEKAYREQVLEPAMILP
jgi:tetratricopeptide (TPR) repeat protein